MISVSLGARYVDASRDFKGFATLDNSSVSAVPNTTYNVDYDETGHGWGGIFGINVTPMEKLNIGLRYETKTSIDLSTHVTTDDIGIVTEGFKRNRDLPALLGLGVSYKFTPKIRVEADLTYYFNQNAGWDDNPVTSGDETQKDDGYDIGIACEYTFNPQWKASVGYMYTYVGILTICPSKPRSWMPIPLPAASSLAPHPVGASISVSSEHSIKTPQLATT